MYTGIMNLPKTIGDLKKLNMAQLVELEQFVLKKIGSVYPTKERVLWAKRAKVVSDRIWDLGAEGQTVIIGCQDEDGHDGEECTCFVRKGRN